MKKRILLSLVCVALMSFSAVKAGVLLDTNFDGAFASGNQLLGVIWTEDAAIDASGTIDGTHNLTNSLLEWVDNVAVNSNLNIIRPTPRGITASFSVTGSVDPLAELIIGHTHTQGVGGLQAFTSDMAVTLTNVTDSVVLFTDTTNYAYALAWQTHSYDLSGISLETGKDYAITTTMQNMVGGGAFATWDQITLTSVPEPATLVLLGLGGLAGLKKRRI